MTTLLPPRMVAAMVDGDLVDPGRKPAPAGEAADFLCQRHGHLLRGILRLGPAAQEAVGDPVKQAIMPLQQKPERGAVAVLRKPDKIEVARTHVSGSFDGRRWQKLGDALK